MNEKTNGSFKMCLSTIMNSDQKCVWQPNDTSTTEYTTSVIQQNKTRCVYNNNIIS